MIGRREEQLANPKHVEILNQGVEEWNAWRRTNREIKPDLRKVNFSGMHIDGIDLTDALLDKANFGGLRITDREYARVVLHPTFRNATLRYARFSYATISGAIFVGADLTSADLSNANFANVYLSGANLSKVTLQHTFLADIDFAGVKGLDTARHAGPSYIDISSVYRSKGIIPEKFLRGCGVPDTMISFAKSLISRAIEYYSAFISYSKADEHFAIRLHNDLQANGVRVWFAPEDLRIGDKLQPTIDEAIRVYDKLIVVLSAHSIHSAWVRHEVMAALKREQQQGRAMLFPIRIDETVFDTTEQWAYEIKDRYIGDFRDWTNPLLYQNAINRLLRDLNAKS